jgi:hypothetical protein
MAGKLMEHLGMAAATAAATAVAIYSSLMKQHSKVLSMASSRFLMACCLETKQDNLIIRASWLSLLATLSQLGNQK